MNYPFWDVGMSYGWLMAAISVIHVYISHFAIGGGLYLVIVEIIARKKNDSVMLEFVQKVSKFFVLTTLVSGALTGVGIWFIIGLLNPAATEVLIHNFVWMWATEWTFFIVEILAAILYLYGWKTMSASNHIRIGWIYFVAAWLSLFAINGIISFMLTPGDWLTTGNVWDGFFNQTFWPTLVLRTGVCLMLAGVFTSMVASFKLSSNDKARIIRHNSIWGLVGLVIMVPSFYWFRGAIPADIMTTALEAMPTPIGAFDLSFWFAGAIGVLLVVFGLAIPRMQHFVVSLVLMAFALLWFGEFEWFRESIRKPYVISGYMYGNATEVALEEQYAAEGYLAHMEYRTGDDGADLFRRVCRSCHTIDGYKPLKPAFDGTDEEYIAGIAVGMSALKGNMPMFSGTEEEAAMIASHIHSQIDNRHLSEIYGLDGVDLGEKVYEVRCGRCHEFGGYNDKYESLVDLAEEDYSDILDIAEDLGEEMPAFTGDDTEREALIQYLMTLGKTKGGK